MSARPFDEWIAALENLGRPTELPAGLDPIEAHAVDSAVGFAAEHARRYVASGGLDDGWAGPRPILLLYTRGRRSGTIRRNPLLYFDHGGVRLVVGSKGGDPGHPSWYLNLAEEPRVHVRVMDAFYAATAETLPLEERAAAWPALVAEYPMFERYQRRASRTIPLVRLVPA